MQDFLSGIDWENDEYYKLMGYWNDIFGKDENFDEELDGSIEYEVKHVKGSQDELSIESEERSTKRSSYELSIESEERPTKRSC